MVDRSILQALFERPPAEAVAFIEEKGLRLTWSWAEMRDEAHARAFTVAKAARMDVLQEIRTGVIDAVRDGKTLREFRNELTPRLQEKGWWGRQVLVDSTGAAELVQLGSPHRLGTIYRTNVHSAYMAGRAIAQQQADSFEYLQYIAIIDERTRHDHAALNGLVFHRDDPVWNLMYPPNDFNCRCRVRAMTAAQAQREGVKPQNSEGRVVTREVLTGLDKRTGELFPTFQSGLRVTGPGGQADTVWISPGFNSSPLAGHGMDTVLAKKAVAALGDEAGFAAVQAAVLSPTRLRAWDGFVDNTLATGRTQHQTMTLGLLPHRVARQMADAATPVAPVMHLDDALIVGRKARRHSRRGEALTAAEWRALPVSLREGTWYRDTTTGRLVVASGDIHTTITRTGKVDTVFRDPLAAQKIADGRWVPV